MENKTNEITISENGESDVLVVPTGEFYGSDKDGNPIPESIDDEVISNLEQQLQGKELLVDKDHSSVKSGTEKDTSAMGWMHSFKKGVEGLWAKISWTNIGRQLIENRVFRFLSPVFTIGTQGKPTNMLNVALTNQPAFMDKAKPIINNQPNTEVINMEMTKEELVELIKSTIADLKKEEKVEEIEQAIESENECHDNIVENLEQEKQDVEMGIVANQKPEDAKKTCAENACDSEEKPVEAMNEDTPPTDEDDTVEEKIEEKIEEKEDDKEDEDDVEEDKKEVKKEVITEDALNNKPNDKTVVLNSVEDGEWKNLHGAAFWKYLKDHNIH